MDPPGQTLVTTLITRPWPPLPAGSCNLKVVSQGSPQKLSATSDHEGRQLDGRSFWGTWGPGSICPKVRELAARRALDASSLHLRGQTLPGVSSPTERALLSGYSRELSLVERRDMWHRGGWLSHRESGYPPHATSQGLRTRSQERLTAAYLCFLERLSVFPGEFHDPGPRVPPRLSDKAFFAGRPADPWSKETFVCERRGTLG